MPEWIQSQFFARKCEGFFTSPCEFHTSQHHGTIITPRVYNQGFAFDMKDLTLEMVLYILFLPHTKILPIWESYD